MAPLEGMPWAESKMQDIEAKPSEEGAVGGPQKSPPWMVVAAAVIGSILEWYDFTIYAFFSKELGHQFFPKSDPSVEIIKSFGVYAGGLVVRPLGGLIFGAIGDRYGSGTALQVAILAMALPTTLIGCLPTYQKVGITAPILLIVLRLLQGLMAGGEIVGALLYAADHTPPAKRGKYTSAVYGLAHIGHLSGAAVAFLVHHFMTPATIKAWGWRVPFLCGSVVGVTGFLVRRTQMASDLHEHQDKHKQMTAVQSFKDVFLHHKLELLQGMTGTALFFAGLYITCIWMGTYLRALSPHRFHPDTAFGINAFGLMFFITIVPTAGFLSDYVGRAPIMWAGSLLLVAGGGPGLMLVSTGRLHMALLGMFCLAAPLAIYSGGMNAWLIDHCRAKARYTAIATGYNLGAAAFAGTGPIIATQLVRRKMFTAVGWYVSGVALLSFLTVTATYLLQDREAKEAVHEKDVEVTDPSFEV